MEIKELFDRAYDRNIIVRDIESKDSEVSLRLLSLLRTVMRRGHGIDSKFRPIVRTVYFDESAKEQFLRMWNEREALLNGRRYMEQELPAEGIKVYGMDIRFVDMNDLDYKLTIFPQGTEHLCIAATENNEEVLLGAY